MRRALDVARSDSELRSRYAELLQSIGRGSDAAVEHACLGHDAAQRGEFEEAVAQYERAVVLSPDDLALRERRVELLEQCGEADALVAAVLDLVQRHLSMGLAERARTTLSGIAERRRLDLREEIVVAWAKVESSLGHWQDAARLYRRLADAVITSDEAKGLEFLHAAAHQDPEDTELAARIDAIESGRLSRARRLRRKLTVAATAVALLGAGGFAGIAELSAARRAADALATALGDLDDGAGIGALAVLEDIRDDFGWTMTGRRVVRWADRIVDIQLEAIRERIARADYDGAHELSENLRREAPRPDVDATCTALLARISDERAAFAVLERVARDRQRPSADDLQQLEALGEPEHLDFLLAQLADVADHASRAAMIHALGRIDSPRAYPVVARIALRARDEVTLRAARSLLRGAAAHRESGREGEWAAVYPELEYALALPDQREIAREILDLLRGPGAD